MTNEGGYSGFQVDLNMPDGVTLVSVAKTDRVPDDWTFADSNPSTGVYRVIGHFNKAANPIITGNSGAFFVVTVSLDAKFKAGDMIACSLTNMEVTPTGTTTAQKVADANFNIEVTDKVILDENSQALPAAQTSDVLVKRTLKKDVWNTICLPFPMNATKLAAAFPDGYEIAKFVGFTSSGDSYTIKFESETVIRKNTPLLIKVKKDITEFTVSNAAIDPVSDAKVDFEDPDELEVTGIFYGTENAGVKVPKNNFFLSGNKFYYSKGTTTMKGFRGYFWLKGFDAASAPEINFEVGGEATKIDGLNVIFDDGQYYNLKGQKVDNPTEKGVYIKNGKKVVIK